MASPSISTFNAPSTSTSSAAKANGKPFLQINRVVKKFDDVFAVDEVSLDIQQGEIFALLGSSGLRQVHLAAHVGRF